MTSVQVDAGELADAAGWIARYAVPRTDRPLEGGVRVTAGPGPLLLEVKGDRAEASCTIGTGPEGGAADEHHVVVSARLLAIVTKMLRRGDVTVEVGGGLHITEKRYETSLPAMGGHELWSPLRPAPVWLGEIEGKALADGAKRARLAIEINQPQVALNSFHIEVRPESLRIIGASRTQSGITEIPLALNEELLGPGGAGTPTALHPHAVTFAEACAGLAAIPAVTIGAGEGRITLTGGGQTVTVADMALAAWPVAAVDGFLDNHYEHRVALDVAETSLALKRAAGIAQRERTPAARFTLADKELRIAAVEGDAQARAADVVEGIAYEGEPFSVVVNPEYFGDALRAAPASTVELSFSPGYPALLLSAPDWNHIVMRMTDR